MNQETTSDYRSNGKRRTPADKVSKLTHIEAKEIFTVGEALIDHFFAEMRTFYKFTHAESERKHWERERELEDKIYVLKSKLRMMGEDVD